MRILASWLGEFVAVPVAPAELARTLSMCGFEVAAVEDAPPGTGGPGAQRTPTGDAVIDFEITANRPDCLSVIGLAREAATAFDRPLLGLPADRFGPDGERGIEVARGGPTARTPDLRVTIEAPDLCPRYAAAIADVRVGPSPAWLAARLEAAGVRPINNVVDVTNYVLLEMGHPMHAFDLDCLAGGELRIRTARPGERIRTLDGEDRPLDPAMLVIADATSPQAIGGVMGGVRSEVTLGSRVVALESAYFAPTSIRRTSKTLGLRTEASTRFERGADIGAPVLALRRAAELMEAIGAGTCRRPIIDCDGSARAARRIPLRRSRLAALLGHPVEDAVVDRILGRLGLAPQPAPEGWTITAPSWRVDLTREVDLVEEVARHHGYDRIPVTFPPLEHVPAAPDTRITRDRLVRRVLTAAGCTEAITFSFVEAVRAAPFSPEADLVPIANPLSEKLAVLRPSLIPGLVEALSHNRRRNRADVRLFELGACFTGERGENRRVAFAWIGAGQAAHWSAAARPVDFFDAKGLIERLCEALGVAVRCVPAATAYLAPGRTAAVMAGQDTVGVTGELAPELVETRDIPAGEEVYVGEIDLDAIARIAPAGDVRFEALPRFPSIVRDLSVLVDRSLPAETVRATIRASAPPSLAGLVEFDRYAGQGIPADRVSLSLRLTFRSPDRTLTDAEVQATMDEIVRSLSRQLGAVQR